MDQRQRRYDVTLVFVVHADSHEQAARYGESLIEAAWSVEFAPDIDTAWVEDAIPTPSKETA